MNKKFEKRLKLPVPLLMAGLLVSISFCLTGCNFSNIPDKYTKKEARDQEKESREIFAQYLEGELGGGKIEKVSVYAAVPPNDVGFYLTDFVDGRFAYEGESYAFVVNTRTEEIYTSLRLQELKKTGTEYVQDYFQISCDEIIESHMDVTVRVPAMSISLAGVVPISLDVSEDSIKAILEDEAYTVNMDIIYKGEWGLAPDGYGIESLPGLKALNIYHMKSKAEVSEELEGIYDYMMSETLKESVREGSPTTRYAEWDHLEEGNFHLFFETYCRECTSGNVVVTELEKGRDIQLLVDDERVEVDCNKDFGYFLFAEGLSDRESKTLIVREYLKGDGNKHRDKLKWLRDGERFVAGMREPEIFNGWSVFYLEDGTKE